MLMHLVFGTIAVLLAVLFLRFVWTRGYSPVPGVIGFLVLLALAVFVQIGELGPGRSVAAALALVLPAAAIVLLAGMQRKPRKQGRMRTLAPDEQTSASFYPSRWLLAGPLAALASFGVLIPVLWLPFGAPETRVAIVFCVWPVAWCLLGAWFLSSDRFGSDETRAEP